MSITRKRDFLEALCCILLLGMGQASSWWFLAPIAAVCGYALAWHLGKRCTSPFLTTLTLFSLANLLHFSWLISHPYAYIYAAWIVASILFAIPFALLSLLVVSKQQPNIHWTIGVAALFTLLEWSYTLLPCGFSFQSAALHLSWNGAPLQIASYIGGIGVAFVVYWTNLLAFLFLEKKISLSPLLLVAALPYVAGGFLLWHRLEEQNQFDGSHQPLRVALFQMEEPPDIFSSYLPPEELHAQEWHKIFSMLAPLRAGEVDLAIFPEGAIPFAAQSPLFDAKRLPNEWETSSYIKLSSLDICQLLAWSKKMSLLIGLEGRALDAKSVMKTYNSLFCIQPGQKNLSRYNKQLLIPFGEYIPSETFRSWLSLYGIHDSFSAGEESVLLTTPKATIAPFICYEETFSTYAVEAARLNPDLLASVSNDNWFPWVRKEHFELARLRAVEVGKPLIRSCNQGVSAAVDAMGRTIISRGERKETENGYTIATVSLYSPHTPFMAVGNWGFAAIFGLIAVVSGLTLSPISKQRKNPPLR